MTFETLRLLRNILLRSFVVGVAVLFVAGTVTLAGWDIWMGFAVRLLHLDEHTLATMITNLFSQLRLFLMCCLLIPGLGIHWTLKRDFK